MHLSPLALELLNKHTHFEILLAQLCEGHEHLLDLLHLVRDHTGPSHRLFQAIIGWPIAQASVAAALKVVVVTQVFLPLRERNILEESSKD